MKTKSLLTLVVFLFTQLVNAQNAEKAKPTGYISVNGGVGIPLGDFSNEYLGGALSGGSFHLNYSVPIFKSNLGITTKIDMGAYEMSTSPFISEQKNIINSLGYKDKVDYNFKTVSYGSYFQTNIMTGLYATLPIKKFCIDARILGGFNSTNRPSSEINFDFFAIGYEETYYEKATTSSSFAYDFGISVRYNMGKKQKICLIVSADLIGANGKFEYDSKRLYYDSAGDVDDVDIQKKKVSHSVSTYNITFGIGYVFGKKD